MRRRAEREPVPPGPSIAVIVLSTVAAVLAGALFAVVVVSLTQ